MVRYYAMAKGRVQGVGFRYYIYKLAGSYGLTGWVHNCADGSVDMEIQGKESHVEAFFAAVEAGDHFIRVDRLDKKQIACKKEETQFGVVF